MHAGWRIPVFCLSVAVLTAAAAEPDVSTPAAVPAVFSSPAAWRAFQAARLSAHPLVIAAQRRVDQARQARAAADAAFDTRLTASAGAGSWPRAVPGSSFGSVLGGSRAGLEAGLERAVLPGAVLAAGVAGRRLAEAESGDEDLYRSLAGVQVRVPLLRDRGLARWRWESRQAEALAAAAAARLDGVLQQLRFDSDSALVDLLQAEADLAAYRGAAGRVARLQAEAEQLVALNVVPEYQLFPARLQASLSAEQVAAAEQQCLEVRARLAALLGPLPGEGEAGGQALLEWATPDGGSPPTLEAALAHRATAAELVALIAAAREAEGAAGDALRPDLSAVLAGTWQGGESERVWASESSADDGAFGYEAALVLSVPLERRAERAARTAAGARTAELVALLDQERRQAVRELDTAQAAVRQAGARLALVGAAVENATRAMQAEAERFRLGEGRSRNVLDAQKDLTDAELRQHAAAGALLRARAALAFAAGYANEPPAPDETVFVDGRPEGGSRDVQEVD